MNDVAAELTECARDLGVTDSALSSSCLPLGDEPSHLRRSRPALRRAGAPDELDESSEELATSAEIPAAKRLKEDAAPEAPLEPTARRGPPGGNRLLLSAGLIVGLAFAAGLAAYLVPGEQDEAEAAATGAATTEVAASPTPTEAPAPREPDPDPDEAAPGTAGSDEPPAPVRVVSRPPGARVRRGGADLGDAPVTVRIPPGETWELTLSLDGYEERTVVASAGRGELSVGLDRLGPRRTGRGHRSQGAPTPDRDSEGAGAEGGEAQASTSQAGSDTTTESSSSSAGGEWDRSGQSDNRDPWAQ